MIDMFSFSLVWDFGTSFFSFNCSNTSLNPWLHMANFQTHRGHRNVFRHPPVTRPVSRALQLLGASGHVPDSLWGRCHRRYVTSCFTHTFTYKKPEKPFTARPCVVVFFRNAAQNDTAIPILSEKAAFDDVLYMCSFVDWHPRKLIEDSPTDHPLGKEKIIWTKPPICWVPAVNFPGSTFRYFRRSCCHSLRADSIALRTRRASMCIASFFHRISQSVTCALWLVQFIDTIRNS